MKKLVFNRNFSTGVFILFLISSFYSCKSDDGDGGSNAFSCENYWEKVNLNGVCELGFPASFTFDSPPQAGQTTICIANVLENSVADYNGNIVITKTPSNENAISAYEAKKSAVSPQNEIQDFDAGGERGFIVKIAGTERYDYTAVKGKFLIQYSATADTSIHPCFTKSNHDAYMRALVAKL